MPSREYYLQNHNSRALQGYTQFAVSVATLLGAPADRAQQEMADMIEFEKAVANVRKSTSRLFTSQLIFFLFLFSYCNQLTTADEDRRDSEAAYHRFTIAELYSNVTQVCDTTLMRLLLML